MYQISLRLVGKRKFMQTMEKVSKNISLIISLFPHLVNALWRGRGTKSIQDFGGGKKKWAGS